MFTRKKRPLRSFSALVAVIAALVLAACGDATATTAPASGSATTAPAAGSATTAPANGSATTAPAANGQKTVVTLMTWEGADTNAAIDKALDQFKKDNPTIDVQRIPSPNSDYSQKLQSLLVAKQLPDIFWAGNDTEQQLGAQSVLYDWTTLAAAKSDSFDLTKFAPGAIDNWKTPDGKLYGLPTLMNTYGFWYNADMLTAAGAKLPAVGMTYDDLFTAAKAVTKKDGDKVSQYGIYVGVGDPAITGPFSAGYCAQANGGQPFTDRIIEPTKVTADDKFVACTKTFVDAVKNGYVTPPGYSSDGLTDSFKAGKVPMLQAGQWLAPDFIKAKPSFKYGFAPMPVGKDSVQAYDAVGIASPKTIKNPDAVWKVSQFLASKAWETILPGAPVAPAAYVPSSQPYFDTLKSSNLTTSADAISYMLSAPKKGAIRMVATYANKATDVLKQWDDILLGKTPVESGTATMVKQLNDVIAAK